MPSRSLLFTRHFADGTTCLPKDTDWDTLDFTHGPDGFICRSHNGVFVMDISTELLRPAKEASHPMSQPALSLMAEEHAAIHYHEMFLNATEAVYGDEVGRTAGVLSEKQRLCFLNSLGWRNRESDASGATLQSEDIVRMARSFPYIMSAAAYANAHCHAIVFDYVAGMGGPAADGRLETSLQYLAQESPGDPMIACRAIGLGNPGLFALRAAAVCDAAESVLNKRMSAGCALWLLKALPRYDSLSDDSSGSRFLAPYLHSVNQGADLPIPIGFFQSMDLDEPAIFDMALRAINVGDGAKLIDIMGSLKLPALIKFADAGPDFVTAVNLPDAFESQGWGWQLIAETETMTDLSEDMENAAMLPPPKGSLLYHGTSPEGEFVVAVGNFGEVEAWLPLDEPVPFETMRGIKASLRAATALNRYHPDAPTDTMTPAPNSLMGVPARPMIGTAFLPHPGVSTSRASMACLLSHRLGGISPALRITCEALGERFQVVCLHDMGFQQNIGYAIIESGLSGLTPDSPKLPERLIAAHLDYLPDGLSTANFLSILAQLYPGSGDAQLPGVEMALEAMVIAAAGESVSAKETAYGEQQLRGALARPKDFKFAQDILYGATELERAMVVAGSVQI